MAAIFPKIYEYIDSNPSKMKGLVFARSEAQVETDINRWDIFTIKPLVVPGPLSLLLCRATHAMTLSSGWMLSSAAL